MDDKLFRVGFEIAFDALQAQNDTDFEAVLRRTADLLECSAPLFGIQVNLAPTHQVQRIVSRFPIEYQLTYAQQGFIGVDPTVTHCLTRLDVRPWDDAMYVGAAAGQMRDAAYAAGLQYGFSVPNRHGENSISMVSLGRDRPMTVAEMERKAKVAAVIGASLHSAAENQVVPRMIEESRPALSPRETECLQWLTAGKTDSEIGEIMNLSEETVRQYVKRIKAKFDIFSRPQAAAYAIRWRFVS